MSRLFYSLRPEEKQFGGEAGRELFSQSFLDVQPVQAWRGQQEVGEGALLLGALWRGGWQELPTLLGCTLPTERRFY